MAKLVFVDNQANATGWAFDTSALFASATTAGAVGIWSLNGSGANVENDRLHATGDVVVASGAITPKEFQITQSRGDGNMPYCSPIINRRDVVSWKIHHYNATVAATIGGAGATFDTQVVGDTFGIKIIAKPAAAVYEEFINPSFDDYNYTGKLYSFEHTATVTTAADNCQAIVDAINADENCPVSASISTADITLTAKDKWTTFEVIDLGGTGSSSTYTAINFAGTDTIVGRATPTVGTGNGWQAVSAEKLSEGYRGGNHNKLHLPMTERYASLTETYDVMEIVLEHSGARAGMNFANHPGNDSLTIEIYIPSGWTDGGGALNEQFAGGGLGAAAASGTSAGATVVLYERAVGGA